MKPVFTKWLDSIANQDIKSRFTTSGKYLVSDLYLQQPMDNFHLYYTDNDPDLTSKDHDMAHVFETLKDEDGTAYFFSQFIESYTCEKNSDSKDAIKIFINPNTKRYHANMVYKKIIDYVESHELYYQIPTKKGLKWYPLFSNENKINFYDLCYKNT